MQWKGMLGSLSDLLGNLTLPMTEPPPAAQALCFVRTLLAMPPGCTSPPNTLSIPFGPSLQPLSQPSRSSIKPCHLSQCSDFMALIFLMICCVISQERCTLESDDINTWPLFAYGRLWLSYLVLDTCAIGTRSLWCSDYSVWCWTLFSGWRGVFLLDGQQSCFLGRFFLSDSFFLRQPEFTRRAANN